MHFNYVSLLAVLTAVAAAAPIAPRDNPNSGSVKQANQDAYITYFGYAPYSKYGTYSDYKGAVADEAKAQEVQQESNMDMMDEMNNKRNIMGGGPQGVACTNDGSKGLMACQRRDMSMEMHEHDADVEDMTDEPIRRTNEMDTESRAMDDAMMAGGGSKIMIDDKDMMDSADDETVCMEKGGMGCQRKRMMEMELDADMEKDMTGSANDEMVCMEKGGVGCQRKRMMEMEHDATMNEDMMMMDSADREEKMCMEKGDIGCRRKRMMKEVQHVSDMNGNEMKRRDYSWYGKYP
ncbi:hypothetical protein BDV96DRAFT_370787 [Lophiotrema nucula]|uniref:Uncharacterized protein n=1 Tax=Lophiotrema nucula TaxID=690887 RepID=A0A6A5ZHP1_9PLEO|nr:hypothetical protein BDV96DRAFT_370787 [Lophiotrema nucula]